MVVGLGVDVIIVDINLSCFCYLSEMLLKNVKILYVLEVRLKKELLDVDFVVGLVLILGDKVLYLIICDMLKMM